MRDPKMKNPRIKDPRIENPMIEDPRIKDPRIEDPRIKDPVHGLKFCLALHKKNDPQSLGWSTDCPPGQP